LCKSNQRKMAEHAASSNKGPNSRRNRRNVRRPEDDLQTATSGKAGGNKGAEAQETESEAGRSVFKQLIYASIRGLPFFGLMQGCCAVLPTTVLLCCVNTFVAIVLLPRNLFNAAVLIWRNTTMHWRAKLLSFMFLPFFGVMWPFFVFVASLVGGILYGLFCPLVYVLNGYNMFVGGILQVLANAYLFVCAFYRISNTNPDEINRFITTVLKVLDDIRDLVSRWWHRAELFTPTEQVIKESPAYHSALRAYDWILSQAPYH